MQGGGAALAGHREQKGPKDGLQNYLIQEHVKEATDKTGDRQKTL